MCCQFKVRHARGGWVGVGLSVMKHYMAMGVGVFFVFILSIVT